MAAQSLGGQHYLYYFSWLTGFSPIRLSMIKNIAYAHLSDEAVDLSFWGLNARH